MGLQIRPVVEHSLGPNSYRFARLISMFHGIVQVYGNTEVITILYSYEQSLK